MASQHPSHALPDGYQLHEYTIDRALSAGGFSIVYLAHDRSGTPFAIKEYLPGTLVTRQQDFALHVQVPATVNISSFHHGLKSFFEEVRTLAKIIHPNVVRVVDFFRANETVYMVMHYEQGRTLQDIIQAHKHGTLKEDFIRRVFIELLNGLREVHTHKLLHLDIKPSNIYLRLDNSPLLIDFGAARRTLTGENASLVPMYTPGFAAPEQYGDDAPLGPWTDIYAVGASIFACLCGYAPQAANLRLEEDNQAAAKKIWGGKYSNRLLEIIDWCLHLDHLERPQSVFALQKALKEHYTPPGSFILGKRKSSMIDGMRAALRKVTNK